MSSHRPLITAALLAGAFLPISGFAQIGLGLNGGPKAWGALFTIIGIGITTKKCSADHRELTGELVNAFGAMQKRNSSVVPIEAWKDDKLGLEYINDTFYKEHPGPTLAECKDFVAWLGDSKFDEALKKTVDEAKQEKNKKHP